VVAKGECDGILRPHQRMAALDVGEER
jgi:hypothetical protein